MSSLSSPPPDPAPPAKTPPLNLTVRPRLIFGKSERFSVRLKSEIFVFAGLIRPFGKRRINVCATTVPARKRPNSHLHRKGTKRGRVAHFAAELNTGYGELHIFWVRKSICLDLNRVERIRSRQA